MELTFLYEDLERLVADHIIEDLGLTLKDHPVLEVDNEVAYVRANVEMKLKDDNSK